MSFVNRQSVLLLQLGILGYSIIKVSAVHRHIGKTFTTDLHKRGMVSRLHLTNTKAAAKPILGVEARHVWHPVGVRAEQVERALRDATTKLPHASEGTDPGSYRACTKVRLIYKLTTLKVIQRGCSLVVVQVCP